jgi:hypothetical protein
MKLGKTGAAALLLLAAAQPPAPAAPPPRIVIEAETAAVVEPPMAIVSAANVPPGTVFVPGAAGECYLEIPEKAGNPPTLAAGSARFDITLPADGEYILWARVWWEGECSNSFTVQIDDGAPFTFGEDATFRVWHWVRHPVGRMARPLRLSAGRHTLRFINREDGVRLDQIVLSADKRFVPVGTETPNAAGNTAAERRNAP